MYALVFTANQKGITLGRHSREWIKIHAQYWEVRKRTRFKQPDLNEIPAINSQEIKSLDINDVKSEFSDDSMTEEQFIAAALAMQHHAAK
jgi:hypothetical protein